MIRKPGVCSQLSFSFILNLHTLFKIYLMKEKHVSDNIKKSQQNLMLFCSG